MSRLICYTCTVERFGEYILEESVSARTVPELIVGVGAIVGEAVELFSKTSSPFCIQVAKQC